MDRSTVGLAPTSNAQPLPRSIPGIKRKAKVADPLFKPRARPAFKPTNSTISKNNGRSSAVSGPHAAPASGTLNVSSREEKLPSKSGDKSFSGFSDPEGVLKDGPCQDLRLVISKKELMEGLRFHALHLVGEESLDIRDESKFTRPVRLHRRDTRATSNDQASEDKAPEESRNGVSMEEKEEIDKRKEARRQEREANLAQVAPSQEQSKRPTTISKKTAQVYHKEYSSEQRRRMRTNYEEKLPWHIEDFDNQHCFVGSNQDGSANMHVAFVQDQTVDSNRWRLLLVEKMYQFKPRKNFRTMTIDEAERAMKKKGRDPEWLERKREANLQEARLEQVARQNKAFFGSKDDGAAGRADEAVDLDFNMEEDFADDEEGDGFFGKDEDEKLAENRIKEDQLNANVFGIKEETEYDRAEARERRDKERKKVVGKGIRKALEKREKNFDLGSDSDDPFGSTSESEDTESERRKLESEKKAKAEGDPKRSGLSTGSNTPSGRKEKHGGTTSDRDIGGIKKLSSSRPLKRSGSPNLSDASGTDASSLGRKRQKDKHGPSSTQPSPMPSRPTSPANTNPPPSSSAPEPGNNSKPRGILTNAPVSPLSSAPALTVNNTSSSGQPVKKRKSAAASIGGGSETDTAGAISDNPAALSDASRQQKRMKLNTNSNKKSVGNGIRSAPQPRQQSNHASISATPSAGNITTTPATASPTVINEPDPSTYPTPAEVYAAIPEGGITTSDLSNLFRNRYRKSDRNQMLTRIKEVARFDKPSRLLFPGKGLKF